MIGVIVTVVLGFAAALLADLSLGILHGDPE